MHSCCPHQRGTAPQGDKQPAQALDDATQLPVADLLCQIPGLDTVPHEADKASGLMLVLAAGADSVEQGTCCMLEGKAARGSALCRCPDQGGSAKGQQQIHEQPAGEHRVVRIVWKHSMMNGLAGTLF